MTAKVAHVSTVDLTPRFLLLAQLRALRDAGFEVTAVSAPGPWVADLEAEGIRHVAWPSATRAWDPRADARAFAELIGILRRGRYDLVHTHNPKPGVMGRLAARYVGVPCILNTVHGLYATPDDRLQRRLPVLAAEWLAARCSDLELYQSAEDLSWARRLGLVRPGRWTLLGNGLDLSRFEPELAAEDRVAKTRRDLGIADDELVVGTVGRIVAEKGYAEFFEAAREIRRRSPARRFLAVGDRDPDKWDSLSEDDLRRVSDDVTFVGWREDVPELMALMDIFVLPSWREGLPRSAIEAAASGLPLVVTDIRGCREVVRNGEEGFLVPPRRADLLAEAIERLLEDPDLRTRMGRAARARAEDRFDERRVVATVVGATRRLLVRSGRLAPRGDEAVRIRLARRTDASQMATLHRRSMPSAFLPRLGHRVLRQLYLTAIADPNTIALVAERDGAFEGCATATSSMGSFTRRFALRRGALAIALAAQQLAHSGSFRELRAAIADRAGSPHVPDAELLSIAVDEGRRRRGVGRALETAIRQGLAERGITHLKVLVGVDNAAANRFYAGCGYRRDEELAIGEGLRNHVWIGRVVPDRGRRGDL